MQQPDSSQRNNARILNWNHDVAKSTGSVVSSASNMKNPAKHHSATVSRQPSKSKRTTQPKAPVEEAEGPTLLDSAGAAIFGLVGLAAGAALTYSMVKDNKTKTTETAIAHAVSTTTTTTTTVKPAKPSASKKAAQTAANGKSYGPSASRTGQIQSGNFHYVKAPSTVYAPSEVSMHKPLMITAPPTKGGSVAGSRTSRANSRARRDPSQASVNDWETVAGASRPRGYSAGHADPDDWKTVVGVGRAPSQSKQADPDDWRTVAGAGRPSSQARQSSPNNWETVAGAGRSAKNPGVSAFDDFETVADASQRYGKNPGMSSTARFAKNAVVPGLDDFQTVADASQQYGNNFGMSGAARSAKNPGVSAFDDFETVADASQRYGNNAGMSRAARSAKNATVSGLDDFQTVADASQKYGNNFGTSGAARSAKNPGVSAFDDFETVADASQRYGNNAGMSGATNWKNPAAASTSRRGGGGYGDDWETVVEQDRPLMAGIPIPDDFETVADGSHPRGFPSESLAGSNAMKPRNIHINTGPDDWRTLVDESDRCSQASRQYSARGGQTTKVPLRGSKNAAPSQAPSQTPRGSVKSKKGAKSTVSMSSKVTSRPPPSDFNSWDTETVLPNDSISCVGR
ncbi:hypothetical protein CFIMG_006453RA [Ceratocystis fimbriata CBS 114723]|uniref:Uncharacterized protein n=1 Tax=Ceratocystis fimbriata CBS 114723 TaxID=1035309 RepID=A0A2C5WUC9_9PEZI|nr:hypothetical protein CFIMG_006453RA [Ceratocystis fimbriata CBS 114723]